MTPHRITIDMKKSGYKQFVNIRQSENESHIIYISLTNGTEPIKLDNDMVATVYLEGISKQWESCDIKDNEIVFTAPILNVGDTKCQIQLSNNNGYSISPTFIIVVENILNVPHFELLEEEPDDWIDNADSYYTFNGIDYIPVKFSSDRNLLTNLEFKTNDHTAGSIVYKKSQAISVSQGRKIYCTTTSNMLSITLKFEYKIGDNLSGKITTKVIDCKAQMPIVTPTITKRQYLENGYTDVVMYVVADSSYIDDNYKLKNTMLEYDEKTYINCNTPYFEKGKYYAMVNDYGNVGNSYNALIQALQEARTYYNKAIKEVSMIDNCIVITYNDNTQYKSGDLKGDGIARLDKSTDGNVDTYTFVTDKGNTFSFTVTNADNTRIEDLYTQLGYKTPLAVFNNEVAYIKELINNLDTKKESVEEHNKSISQLKNSLSIINTQLSILNNNKVEKDTYTTAIESLQSLVTKLQNSKVDTNTYNDEIANLTTAISELNDKQIDTNAIKESITELDTKKLNKEEYNQYKENVANTFANTDNNIKTNKTSIESLSKDFNTYKTATNKAIKDNAGNINLLDTNKADLVQSKNLFDLKSYLDMLSNNQRPVVNGVLNNVDKSNNSFTFTTTGHGCYTNFWFGENSFKVPVEKNTTYTMSWDFSGSDGSTFVFFNGVTGSGNMVQTKNSNKKLTFTTKEDTTFVTVRFGINDNGTSATIGNIQIELGEVATDYMPCRVATGVKELDNKVDKLQDFNNDKFNAMADKIIDNSIKNTTDKASNTVITDSSNYNIVSLVADNDNYNLSLYGKNLQDFKSLVKMLHTNDYVSKDSLTIDNNTISYDMLQGKNSGIYFKYNEFIKDSLLIDKSCVISLTVTVDKSCTFRLLDESSNKSVSKVLEPSTETQISLPITLNQSTKAITFYGVNITETTHIKLSNIMIELGSVATGYEEYKDMQSVTQDTDLSKVHTYYPNTTIIADSNVQLSYVADTKHYIDNKFNELATAIVAHESEVN